MTVRRRRWPFARWRPLANPFVLHRPVALVVRADPALSVQTLIEAARPSTERLHLRNLFMRYTPDWLTGWMLRRTFARVDRSALSEAVRGASSGQPPVN